MGEARKEDALEASKAPIFERNEIKAEDWSWEREEEREEISFSHSPMGPFASSRAEESFSKSFELEERKDGMPDAMLLASSPLDSSSKIKDWAF